MRSGADAWLQRQLERVRGRSAVLRDRALRRYFPTFERLGVHAVPRHWFEPIPDRSTLTDAVFERRSDLVGVDLRLETQLALLRTFSDRYGDEFRRLPSTAAEAGAGEFFLYNGTFESVDAEILYSMLRWLAPKKLIEVGLGYSSVLIDQVLRRNEADTGIRCHHIGIDPWPESIVERIADLEVVRQPVEETPIELFESLQGGDVLFLDSTHVVRTGGDVVFEYLEVLPRLAPGVVVHIHDIFLPNEYPRRWLIDQLWFPTEQYLLQAFLTDNDAYEVLWSGAALAASHPLELSEAIPSRITELGPGSFWIRRLDDGRPQPDHASR